MVVAVVFGFAEALVNHVIPAFSVKGIAEAFQHAPDFLAGKRRQFAVHSEAFSSTEMVSGLMTATPTVSPCGHSPARFKVEFVRLAQIGDRFLNSFALRADVGFRAHRDLAAALGVQQHGVQIQLRHLGCFFAAYGRFFGGFAEIKCCVFCMLHSLFGEWRGV